jgi:threonine dehydratase
MKPLIYGILLVSILFASCSKKSSEQPPQPHTIKVTVSGADAFNVSLSEYKTTDSGPKIVDAKSIAKGSSYSYTSTLNQNDEVTLAVSSDVSNTVTYRIYDNDKIVVQDTDKEVVTHGSVTVSYYIP